MLIGAGQQANRLLTEWLERTVDIYSHRHPIDLIREKWKVW
jgi:hypothetical protein